jgi:hypothetical protein
MAERLETAEAFSRTLAEVELLLHESEAAGPGRPGENKKKVAVLNKSAVLLLTGKFEAFLEDAAEDFLFLVNKVGAFARHIPLRLLAEHTANAIRIVEQKVNNGELEAIRTLFLTLGRRWTDVEPCSDLQVSCQFNYGKHGELEIVKLFKRIGFENVFDMVLVPDETEELEEGKVPRMVDVKGIVNSLTGIRNNILHQDATPELTTESLRRQCAALAAFAKALVAHLQTVVDKIERCQQSSG